MPNTVALDHDRASLRALFSYGFRPLFLGAAVYGVVAMAVWVGGGRVIPAFTHNWLHLNVAGAEMPIRYGWLEATAIATVAAVTVLQVIPAPDRLLGSFALAAAVANGARLLLWRGLATSRAPIVWVLHLAYAWLAVGLALISVGAVGSDMRNVAAMHAFGAGPSPQ